MSIVAFPGDYRTSAALQVRTEGLSASPMEDPMSILACPSNDLITTACAPTEHGGAAGQGATPPKEA
jgi:hypothetical protein